MNNRYICQAIDFKIYDAEGDKAEKIGVELRVVEGSEAGKTFFWYGSLHENAQQYTVEALRNMGWTCNDISVLEGLGSLKFHVVEKPTSYLDKRTGKMRQSTQLQIWPIKTPKPTLEADKKASFAARFKALAVTVPKAERSEMNAGLPADALPEKVVTGNGTSATSAETGAAVGGPVSY